MGPLDITTAVIGLMLLGSGLYGLLNPSNMARGFGIVSVTREMLVFYPGLAGRNLCAGITVWAFKFAGQRRALGIFLMCWSLVAYVDIYLLLQHYEPVDSVGGHVFGICLFTVVGALLVRSS